MHICMCVYYAVQSALLNHIIIVSKMSYVCKISCHIDVTVLAEKFSSFFHMECWAFRTQAGPTSPCGGASVRE